MSKAKCEYCQTNAAGQYKLIEFASKQVNGMRFVIALSDGRVTVDYSDPRIGRLPVRVALPINFCPMCGRPTGKEVAEE